MKRGISALLVIGILLTSILSITACTDKYEEYLGVYECIYVTADGTDILNRYEYYTLELKKNRNMVSRFKLCISPYSSAETRSKFDIDGEKFTETVGIIKNEYKYIDGTIILEATAEGMNLVAKFKRPDTPVE